MSSNVISNNTYINPFMDKKFAGSVSLHTQLLSFIAHLFNIDIAGVLTKEKNVEAGNRIFDDMLKSLIQTDKNKYINAQCNMEIIYDETFKKFHMKINGEEFNFDNITGKQWKNLTDYIHKVHPFDKDNYNIESNNLYSADMETEFMGNIDENIASLLGHKDIDKTIISNLLSGMNKNIKPDNHWKYSNNIDTGENNYTIIFNHSEDGLSITCGEKNVLIGNNDRRTGYIMSHLENKNPTKMDESGIDKHSSYAIELLSETLKDTISLFYNYPEHKFSLENIQKGELTLDGYQQWFYFIDTNDEYVYPIVIESKSPYCLPSDNAHELRIMGNGPRITCLKPDQIINFDDKLSMTISKYLNDKTNNKNIIKSFNQMCYTFPARLKQGILDSSAERLVYNRWQEQERIQKAKASEKTPLQEETEKSKINGWDSPDVNSETTEPLKSVGADDLELHLHEYNRLCNKANTDSNPESRDVIINYLKGFIKNHSINDMASMGFQLQDLLKIYPLTRDNLIAVRENLKKHNINIQEFFDYLPGNQYNGSIYNYYIDDNYIKRLAMLIWAGFNTDQLKEYGYSQLKELHSEMITLVYLKKIGVTIDDLISCYGYDSKYLSASLRIAGFSVKEQIQHAKNTRDSHLMNDILQGYMTLPYEVRNSGVSAREIKEICDADHLAVNLGEYFPEFTLNSDSQ